MDQKEEPEVIEVEAERIDDSQERAGDGSNAGQAWKRPIMGLVIDLADFLTPVGMPPPLKLLIGAGLGWWIGGELGLEKKRRLTLAALGAAYCTIRGTERLPMGTLVGMFTGVSRGTRS